MFISLGFGKAKAAQCYVSLLVWIIIVSIGLYWFLNRTGTGNSLSTAGLTAVHNSAAGVNIDKEDRRSKSDTKQSFEGKEYSGNDEADSWENGEILQKSKASKKQTKNIKLQRSENRGKGVFESSQQFKAVNSHFMNVHEEREPENKNSFHSSVTRLCNSPDSIKTQDENAQLPEHKLDALIILFRHGDRGPLSHIGSRNVSHINCTADSPDFHNLIRFATESITKMSGYSQFIGPFHSFPKVPTSSQCSLGQLTQLGSAQLITLGKIIRSAYQSVLLNTSSSSSNSANHLKVISYSTRYRRTFQSLIAFLYGLIGPKFLIASTTIRESQSITFCFNDCSCRAADRLKKAAMKKYKPISSDKAAMMKLINHLNSVVSVDKTKKTGTSLLDSLLLYPCHKADLPCHQGKTAKSKVFYQSSNCVTEEDLSNLIRFIEKENHGMKKIAQNRKHFLLSSYGLLKEIVNLALKMTSASYSSSSASGNTNNNINTSGNNNHNSNSNSKVRMAIFSGHDTTLQSLTGALGIFTGHPDIHLPPYASRIIFEFYRKTNVPPNSARKHYFRVIYNGLAVTHLVTFCKTSAKHQQQHVDGNRDSNVNLLCPMERLVRFLHDHYFESFGNATNFKDACTPKK